MIKYDKFKDVPYSPLTRAISNVSWKHGMTVLFAFILPRIQPLHVELSTGLITMMTMMMISMIGSHFSRPLSPAGIRTRNLRGNRSGSACERWSRRATVAAGIPPCACVGVASGVVPETSKVENQYSRGGRCRGSVAASCVTSKASRIATSPIAGSAKQS